MVSIVSSSRPIRSNFSTNLMTHAYNIGSKNWTVYIMHLIGSKTWIQWIGSKNWIVYQGLKKIDQRSNLSHIRHFYFDCVLFIMFYAVISCLWLHSYSFRVPVTGFQDVRIPFNYMHIEWPSWQSEINQTRSIYFRIVQNAIQLWCKNKKDRGLCLAMTSQRSFNLWNA